MINPPFLFGVKLLRNENTQRTESKDSLAELRMVEQALMPADALADMAEEILLLDRFYIPTR